MTHTRRYPWACILQTLRLLATATLATTLQSMAFAQSAPSVCGELWNAYGPYDYRSDRDRLADGCRDHLWSNGGLCHTHGRHRFGRGEFCVYHAQHGPSGRYGVAQRHVYSQRRRQL